MTRKRIKIFLGILLLACCQVLMGRGVSGVHTTLVQPDGTTVESVLSGDEAFRLLTDLQGHALIKQRDGWWCYAWYGIDGTRYSSGHIAGREAPQKVLAASLRIPADLARRQGAAWREAIRTAHGDRPGLLRRLRDNRPSTKADDPIRKHSLILLVQFSDEKGKMRYTRDEFVQLITQSGYNRGGAIGCANDYFDEMFQGDYRFQYTISEVITLDNTCADYFLNDGNTIDINADLAVMEACRKAHDLQGIDFSVFDDDGDGEVDNVFLFAAGRDEADCADEDCLWSHMFYLSSSKKKEVTDFSREGLDGVRISNYAITSELRAVEPGRYDFTSIGTFCHEYSHTLNLPDLYDTDYEGSGGYGNGMWYTTALMDGGNTNMLGTRPPHYNAIEYDQIGIGTCEPLQVGTYRLEPISRNRRYLKMETGADGEYFLFECRGDDRWDAGIGGRGLLIYHIDQTDNPAGFSDAYNRTFTSLERWEYNEVNCRPDHECAQLIPATPGLRLYSGKSRLGNQADVFFPTPETDAFTALTDPPFVFWNGASSPLAITQIARDGEDITFTVSRLTDVEIPEVVYDNELDVFQDAAILRWRADDPTYDGPGYVTWGTSSGVQKEIEVQPYAPGRYAVTLDGLSPVTSYRATLFFRQLGITSKERTVKFTTKRKYDRPYIYLGTAKRNSDGSFPEGSELPLRVFNCPLAEGIQWYFDGEPVSTSANGYFALTRSGALKVVIRRADGTTDVILKTITVR